MFLARVFGSVWATRKNSGLVGKRLLLVDPVQVPGLRPTSKPVLAVCDRIDAGIGDLVLVLDEGGSARVILGNPDAPVRTLIVGVVDAVETEIQPAASAASPARR